MAAVERPPRGSGRPRPVSLSLGPADSRPGTMRGRQSRVPSGATSRPALTPTRESLRSRCRTAAESLRPPRDRSRPSQGRPWPADRPRPAHWTPLTDRPRVRDQEVACLCRAVRRGRGRPRHRCAKPPAPPRRSWHPARSPPGADGGRSRHRGHHALRPPRRVVLGEGRTPGPPAAPGGLTSTATRVPEGPARRSDRPVLRDGIRLRRLTRRQAEGVREDIADPAAASAAGTPGEAYHDRGTSCAAWRSAPGVPASRRWSPRRRSWPVAPPALRWTRTTPAAGRSAERSGRASNGSPPECGSSSSPRPCPIRTLSAATSPAACSSVCSPACTPPWGSPCCIPPAGRGRTPSRPGAGRTPGRSSGRPALSPPARRSGRSKGRPRHTGDPAAGR